MNLDDYFLSFSIVCLKLISFVCRWMTTKIKVIWWHTKKRTKRREIWCKKESKKTSSIPLKKVFLFILPRLFFFVRAHSRELKMSTENNFDTVEKLVKFFFYSLFIFHSMKRNFFVCYSRPEMSHSNRYDLYFLHVRLLV